jgi:outer membrane protein assembly factor BamD
MHNPERDQTETHQAITELTQFVQRYPQSELLQEGKQHLQEARDRLSQAGYRVGLFYWRARWYPGAIDRFKAVLADNPTFSTRDALYFHLADSLVAMKRPAEALPYYEKLIAEFEASEYLEDARKRSAALKTELAKDGTTGTASR